MSQTTYKENKIAVIKALAECKELELFHYEKFLDYLAKSHDNYHMVRCIINERIDADLFKNRIDLKNDHDLGAILRHLKSEREATQFKLNQIDKLLEVLDK